ncbi:MAG: peptidoglycan DD-metalloendopeptidase family protein [Paracoccaceae bacterium]
MKSPLLPSAALRASVAAGALALLAACDQPLDLDLRGGSYDTTEAALQVTAPRPEPDDRGVISYPNYQVAVARRGDRLADVAERVGIPAEELARFNGVEPDTRLRPEEVIALPRRVAEPSPETGAPLEGPIRPSGEVDVASVAGQAIESASPSEVRTSELPATEGEAETEDRPQREGARPRADQAPQTGLEPVRHQVERGETAYTISRLYDVSVRALAEWNGLGPDFAIREGQYLLIPVPAEEAPAPRRRAEGEPPRPGQGSPTPEPPSAERPMPQDEPAPADEEVAKPASPDLSEEQDDTEARTAMSFPVEGPIIRDYAKGSNDGITIGAEAGAPVTAAASGTVAAITADSDQVPIVVIRHPDNLLTVYANLGALAVEKGDSVSRGQRIAEVRAGDPPNVHFEVRQGFESVDPMTYLR